MIDKYQTGQQGENIAVDYLISKGYRVIERNWRKSRFELDIIAEKLNLLVFVEVKAGKDSEYGPPELKVDTRKQKRIAQAAGEYLMSLDKVPEEIRFDVVVVLNPNSDNPEINHIKSAFTADFD